MHVQDTSNRSERRDVQRFHRNASSITFIAGPADMVIGKIHDQSVSGVGILTSRYFAVGTAIGLQVPATSITPMKYLAAEVRHATAQPDGFWLLGCALLKPLTIDEILAFG